MLTSALAGRVVLVTGAARGIGAAIARTATAEGARVAVHYSSSEEDAQVLSAELEGSRVFRADLSRPAECRRLVDEVDGMFGALDVLVNNAGTVYPHRLDDTDDESWNETLAVNLSAPFFLTRAAVPVMRRRGNGAVVNVASIAGLNGGNMGPAYAASKGGLVALTKALARECAEYGIRVNAVAPTLTATPMIQRPELAATLDRILAGNPMHRLAEPEEVAATVVYLCSSAASFVNGACVPITGGPV